ncbi:hypothetical protein PaG_02303 [Moesziomyces aphidis]|uniref:Uncharacterized protein n=1 Tax=Moesziomyces aphidis TaxID=84754 RepID=W3VQX1_MOEAP|nr:hypothetical protein PaG_02303 [Moesziomyces aphidis]
MPPASRATRTKKEPAAIDLSFLSSDEEFAAFRTDSPKKATQSKRAYRAQTSTTRTKSATRTTSSRGQAARHTNGSSSRSAPRRRFSPVDSDDDDDDDDDQASSDSPQVSQSTQTRRLRRGSAVASQKQTRSRAAPAPPPARATRSRRPLLANYSDVDSDDGDHGRRSTTRAPASRKLRGLEDFVVDDSDDDDPPQHNNKRSTRSAAPSRPTRRVSTRQQKAAAIESDDEEQDEDDDAEEEEEEQEDEEDDDDDDDDDLTLGCSARSRNRHTRSNPRAKRPTARRPKVKRDDTDDWMDLNDDDSTSTDEDQHMSNDDESEDDELVDSDEVEFIRRANNKRSAPSRSSKASKRPRNAPRSSATSTRRTNARRAPRRKASSRPQRPPKMRFALQQELPEPSLDEPDNPTPPVIDIPTETTLLEDHTFIDGVPAICSSSEHEAEQEEEEDESASEQGYTSTASYSEEAELMAADQPCIDRHWPGCKRCKDGPALPLYNKSLTTLKRQQTREQKKRLNKSPDRIDSRGRQRKALIDDAWGALTPVQQTQEWMEVLEDRGGWFECSTCSVSWHWGCLPLDSQKSILHTINTEATRRHRSIFGQSAPPPDPVRRIDVDEFVNTASCPDCAGYAAHCIHCKADVNGHRTTEEQLGITQAMLDAYPKPPTNLTATRLFRCRRCSRPSHYECIARASDQDDPSAEHAAKLAQDGGWLCADCHRWPAVDKIIAWRPLDRSQWNDDSNRAYAALHPRENLPREYLVKFKDRSYRETEWVPHDWLRILHQMALMQFLAKGSRLELEPAELVESDQALANARKSRASLALGGGGAGRALVEGRAVTRSIKKTLKVDDKGDVDVGPPSPMHDAQRRIPKAWKTPDRILAVKFYSSMKNEDGDDERSGDMVDSDSISRHKLDPSDYLRSWQHVAKLYIKWQDQPYEGATWEDPPTRRKQADVFYEAQEAYRAFLVAQQIVFPALTQDEKRRKRERRLARSGSGFRALDDQPSCVQGGDLIDFQLEGVNWLRYGWYHQKPGILADEMGLGKTVQVITFLASLWKEGKAGPFLVVVPNSTLPNWMREFEKWMSQFRVVPYWGESEARDMISRYEFFHSKKALAQMDEATRAIKFHVVVAADSTVRLDSLPLRKVESWDVIIVDEGQNLKSGKSLLLKRLNELHAEHRVIMTGTPLNNNTTELFNLLNWLEPGGQWKDVKALEAEYSALKPEVIEELQQRLRPYFLRRLKKEVLDLPPKIELIVPTSLRPIQKRIYRSILESNVEDIQALAASRGPGGKRNKKSTFTNLNNTLMQLRKCIQHPYLIAPDLETREDEANYEATWEHQRLIDASGKLSLLQRLLPKLKAGGHRILLFSQFVINLDIVEVFLRGEGYKFLRLDGDVGQKQRQKGIDAFNAPDSPYFVYMISTRAGGVGINLATADTVIIMDPDWNPHVDMQAIARAHRIGQTKKLLVFTLMCKATVEERILQGAKRKMMLDHLIVQNLNNEEETPMELESILKFGAQALFAEGGTEESERDVRYSDKDLDSLLMRREDAEDEPVADAAVQANGEDKGTFSYARVWEADASAATTAAVAPTAVVDDDFWADLLQKHRDDAAKRASEAREKELAEKRASRRDRIRSMLEEEADKEAEPAPAKGKRGRPKKVPQQVVDEDWRATADAGSDSDDYEMIDAVLQDEEDLPAVQALRRRQINSSNAAVAAAAAAVAVAVSAAATAVTVATAQSVAQSAAQSSAAGSSAGATAVPSVLAAPPAPRPASRPAPTAARPLAIKASTSKGAATATSPKIKNGPPTLAGLQRELIAEHRLPSPSPLHDLDASQPVSAIRPGHLAAMRRVLLTLLPEHDFARDVAERAASGRAPDVPPPSMRFQLTETHVDYYMQSFGVPRPVFDAAFSKIPEESIPPEILALPYGGAIALDWRKIRELLVRTATYMVVALRTPKSEAPWVRAIMEWEKKRAQVAPAVIEIADSPPPDREVLAPQTITAAAGVLVHAAKRQAWLEAVQSRGDEELTKTARLAVENPTSRSAPSVVLFVQGFMEGRMERTPYLQAKLSVRNSLDDARRFVDPDTVAMAASAVASPGKPTNRVSAALSRLAAFSGGSPRTVDVSRRDLGRLSMDVVVSSRKPRIKSSRSSAGTPRLSVAPSVDGSVAESVAESDEAPSEQTCIICGGEFHFLNRCPAMQDTNRASARWFQLCDQLRVLLERGRGHTDADVATIKTTIRVMAIKLNGPRALAGQAVLVPPFE